MPRLTREQENELDEMRHQQELKRLRDEQRRLQELGELKNANQIQVDGTHYQKLAIQPWDYILQNNLGWCEGNIIKYITRWRDKNGLRDLEKVRHYLDKLIETEKGKQDANQNTPKG